MCLNAVIAVCGFRTRHAGSALTMALWLIVIGSLLVLVLLQFRQQSSSALVYQVQGQRCYALAKSQLELALVQLLFDQRMGYSATHALLCAGLCELVAPAARLADAVERKDF